MKKGYNNLKMDNNEASIDDDSKRLFFEQDDIIEPKFKKDANK